MTTEALLFDAGVWVAAVDHDDPFSIASRELVLDSSRPVAALDLTLYEVANAVGSKMGRQEEARNLCRSVEDRCNEAIVRIDRKLIWTTIDIAIEYGLTSYDATYVAVARRHGWTLISTDIKDLVSKGLAITPDAAV